MSLLNDFRTFAARGNVVDLAVGVIIGILQAATSINEMTLSFIPKLIGLYREGQLDLDSLVTKEYTLEQINDGYDDMRSGKNIRGVLVYE